MRALALLVVGLVSLTATAGGISFGSKYVGKHPINGNAVTVVIEKDENTGEETVSIHVADTIGNVRGLKRVFAHRDQLEAIFNLHEDQGGPEKKPGPFVGSLVTTGDCQHVTNMALVFRSGVTVPLALVKKAEAQN